MVTANASELLPLLQATLQPRVEVLEAYLYGSCARGDAASHSDIDVAAFVTSDSLLVPGFGIAAQLSALLQTGLRRSDVDLALLNCASPLLYYRVLRDGVRILSRDLAATSNREGMALSRYCDYLPQLRIVELEHRNRIAAGGFGQ